MQPADTESAPPDLTTLNLAELRAHRQRLLQQEQLVSYWRRVVHARLDLLEVPCDEEEHVEVPDLVIALGGPRVAERRPALLWALRQPMAVIPDVGDVWLHPLHPRDPGNVAETRRESAEAEALLSARRQVLFAELDNATAELISRYASRPGAALELLPDS